MNEMIQVCGCVARLRVRAGSDLAVDEVVHVAPGEHCREQDQRYEHQAGPLEVDPGGADDDERDGEPHGRSVPRLPPAALRPSAAPFSFAGKKKEMLAIEEAKLPPPNAGERRDRDQGAEGELGALTAHAIAPEGGRSRSRAETTVQLRPPKRGTANV